MFFVGIIEENPNAVNEITQYVLRLENYSLLFICSSLDEYKSLPAGKRNRADIIIIDRGEHNFDKLSHIQYIKQERPETPVLFLSTITITNLLSAKLKQPGADSFISNKNIGSELLWFFEKEMNRKQNGVEKTAAINSAIKNRAVMEKTALTNREFEIIELVAKGLSNKKIAAQLYISQYTVNAHLRKIFVKLSVNSRVALVNHIINELA
jgi:two-component system, NarL family, response regulator LiaR